MTLYNSIGKNYNATRQSDPRIVARLIDLLDLPLGSRIADVGAGTGNYSRAIADAGYEVVAIEPSAVMRNQAKPHERVSWIAGSAEQIPLEDRAVDGVVVMLALHHFKDLEQGLKELNRITTRKMVLFAFEQAKIPEFWLTDYFPYFVRDTLATFPSTQEIARSLRQIGQKEVAIVPYLLPRNLGDLFAASGWCQPEIYLSDRVRQGISSFAKMSANELEAGLDRLQAELGNGVWSEKYGYLLRQSEYDAGYRIIVTK